MKARCIAAQKQMDCKLVYCLSRECASVRPLLLMISILESTRQGQIMGSQGSGTFAQWLRGTNPTVSVSSSTIAAVPMAVRLATT